jgi:hypothetical protein
MELSIAQPQIMRQDIPCDDASLTSAKAYNASERQKCKDELGIDFDADGFAVLPRKAHILRMPIGPRTLPMEQQLDLNESVDALVGQYGLAQVVRTVRLLAEMNGWHL